MRIDIQNKKSVRLSDLEPMQVFKKNGRDYMYIQLTEEGYKAIKLNNTPTTACFIRDANVEVAREVELKVIY